MGRGDKRTKRGKISAGTSGKSRPRPKKENTKLVVAKKPAAKKK